MLTYGLTADAAFDMLRFHSMHQNVKVRDLAATIAGLLEAGPTSTANITRFDRLLDQAAQDLRTPVPAGSGSSAPEPASLSPSGRPEPAVIIAGNTPELPLIYVNDAFTSLTG